MGGMNSQIHLVIETGVLEKLRIEAEQQDISVSEMIRRKLSDPATNEEVILLRKIRRLIKND
jgi:hypothetical protein